MIRVGSRCLVASSKLCASVFDDPFDPNTWSIEPHQYRMYADRDAGFECLVDEEDYLFFTQWLWQSKRSPCGKVYFRRAISRYESDGKRSGADTLYLHIEILKRACGHAPTMTRSIADHWNGDSLDNRRSNLRWVTRRQNNRNRFGRDYYQRVLVA